MTTSTGVMSRLKTATDDLHRMAEGRRLQRSLAKGTLPTDRYAAFLSQMYLVHKALEEAIDRCDAADPVFGAVFRDYHRRVGNLSSDLEFLGADPASIEPTGATTALLNTIDRTRNERPAALLGMLYVLEGSTNGSRFIAAALRRTRGLEPGPGLLYMDPHGELQPQRWAAFKRDMDTAGFTEPQVLALVETAKQTFQAIADISDELMQAYLSAP